MTDAVACFAQRAAAFAALHAHRETTRFVENLDVGVETIAAGALDLPVTVNDPSKVNAWVGSPLTTYVRYANDEAHRVAPRVLVPALAALIAVADRAMRHAVLDRAVTIDNWLVSTNLHPPLSAIDLDRVLRDAVARWPRHAIWIRSLNAEHHADWMKALSGRGFAMIPTRQVYLFDGRRPAARLRHNLRIDLRLLAATPLAEVHHADFRADDFEAAARLYAQLYLDKYSAFNPRYTARFLAEWHRVGLLECSGFRDGDGRLCAVLGLFRSGSEITAPIVGYDTSLPRTTGLYRLLMAQVFRATIEHGLALNLSAGAAAFKRLRGCVPSIEYSAVWSQHLPWRSRAALAGLRAATTSIGMPLMKRYAL